MRLLATFAAVILPLAAALADPVPLDAILSELDGREFTATGGLGISREPIFTASRVTRYVFRFDHKYFTVLLPDDPSVIERVDRCPVRPIAPAGQRPCPVAVRGQVSLRGDALWLVLSEVTFLEEGGARSPTDD